MAKYFEENDRGIKCVVRLPACLDEYFELGRKDLQKMSKKEIVKEALCMLGLHEYGTWVLEREELEEVKKFIKVMMSDK